jgi:hypothetical protein
MNSHLSLLGCRARDKVTGIEGVVTTVSFDLYGCIQAVLTQKADEKGEYKMSPWFDVTRLDIVDHNPVMTQPNFELGYVAEGKKGAAEKPQPM